MKQSRLLLVASILLLSGCSSKQQDATAKPVFTPTPSIAVAHQDDKEKCTNEPRTDDKDKHPRCGGMGAVQSVPAHAYRVTLDNGESITSCDITKPFSGKIGRGMITLMFTPEDDRHGTMAFHFANGQGIADTSYDYTLSGSPERMTGTMVSNSAVCGKAAGMGVCGAVRNRAPSSTWARIDSCKGTT